MTAHIEFRKYLNYKDIVQNIKGIHHSGFIFFELTNSTNYYQIQFLIDVFCYIRIQLVSKPKYISWPVFDNELVHFQLENDRTFIMCLGI